jgi:hypothetical protein
MKKDMTEREALAQVREADRWIVQSRAAAARRRMEIAALRLTVARIDGGPEPQPPLEEVP